jgi:hypothetical protein
MDSDKKNTRNVVEVRVPSTVAQITAENSNYGRIQSVKFTKKYAISVHV